MKDFIKIYQLQDKILSCIKDLNMPIYLTGGTAIGRFYLDHRYCDSLYCNVDDGNRYLHYISELKNEIETLFFLDLSKSYFTEDFTRFMVIDEDIFLKVEMVRNINKYEGKLMEYTYGLIDTPNYILAKKVRAITWRNELEDFFDIVHLCHNYSFNWIDFYSRVKQGTAIGVLDIENQMVNYPVDDIEKAHWLKQPFDLSSFKNDLKQIAKDFVTGSENSLGICKTSIKKAQPLIEFQI